MTTGRHHLDHASTTPLRPAARDAMVEALDTVGGDPSRVHTDGVRARAVLEDARDRVAAAFGARSREVVFTSGATESIAAACWGAADRGEHQVVPAVEHSAVRLSAAMHGPVRAVDVDGVGRATASDMIAAIDDATALVHLQWGNHEVGTVQPVADVASSCRDRGVLLHVDAAQAAGRTEIDVRRLGADLVSISGHKLGGPPGSGVLFVRRGVRLRSLLAGGDQELARRAGLENVAAAVGLAAAVESIDVAAESSRQSALSDELRRRLGDVAGVTLYGDPQHRLPHVVSLGIADVEPQAVLFGLDRRGINAHSGSACASADLEPSPVLAAMGVDAHHSLRLSVGWTSTEADIEAVCQALPEVLAELRALGRPSP